MRCSCDGWKNVVIPLFRCKILQTNMNVNHINVLISITNLENIPGPCRKSQHELNLSF